MFSLLQYFIWNYCIVLEHILLETNIKTSKLRILLTLNGKKLTKRFGDGINGKIPTKGFMNLERKAAD